MAAGAFDNPQQTLFRRSRPQNWTLSTLSIIYFVASSHKAYSFISCSSAHKFTKHKPVTTPPYHIRHLASIEQDQDKTPPSTHIQNLKSQIANSITSTNRGKSATATQQSEIEHLLRQLESACLLDAPARDERMEGRWIVEYSTAPPPSNGQLGPFDGVARQFVDLKRGTYVNELSVPPGDWLQATLSARWMEWDGVFLESGGDGIVSKGSVGSSNSGGGEEEDYGATCWKVDFDKLSIGLFGIELFSKKFSDTSRVWKMSYLDDDTRVVRAGRTGRGDDDFVFYMTRDIE